ncbi:3-beta hydroxysteroid dehydrogenase/isomerase family-domain-containing protein [Lophiotrema nucula]|uniref:Sterol-4-alpha-carboxylate 3-dehydrogenase ERG26, decarboxylating n=1 Tax=Lophiotrema nucula TaxID=690887 RepID=A0A6A5YQX3_9PLEO|nr:3-beta hydroxysteroid dehydrogenase/isomerase family-domain-containing protein [Lophiotrema nucula]
MTDPEKYAPSLGKVLIVGGCGFLGHHIVDLLVERHPQTRVFVLDLRTNSNRNSSSTVSYHDGDITDLDFLKMLFSELRPDAIIHTAATHFTAVTKEIMDKVNIGGTKNLLEAAKATGVKAFVYTSSASVILSPERELINADETFPLVTGKAQPEYYTTTKAYAETAVLEANQKDSNLLTCAIRPAGIFGEGDVQLLPPIMHAYFNRQTKFQIGNNDNLFDFTYVANVAHGHLLAAQALLHPYKMLPTAPLDSERVDGEAFFITNGQPVYFWDFARAIWHECGDRLPLSQVWHLSEGAAWAIGGLLEGVFFFLGRKPKLSRAQARYSTITKYHSIDKARKRLGYAPILSLDEGIRRGVQQLLSEWDQQKQKKSQ